MHLGRKQRCQLPPYRATSSFTYTRHFRNNTWLGTQHKVYSQFCKYSKIREIFNTTEAVVFLFVSLWESTAASSFAKIVDLLNGTRSVLVPFLSLLHLRCRMPWFFNVHKTGNLCLSVLKRVGRLLGKKYSRFKKCLCHIDENKFECKIINYYRIKCKLEIDIGVYQDCV